LGYHFPSCDALIAGAGSEIFRLNLEQGRFMQPLELSAPNGAPAVGVNALDINSAHQLLAFGAEAGGVHFWDPRSRSSVGYLPLPERRLTSSGSSVASVLPGVNDAGGYGGVSVTALASRSDGLSYAVGTSTGHTLLYDIRTIKPFAIKDQGYGLPLKKVSWIDGGSRMAGDGLVMSADTKVVKIWDRNTVREVYYFIFTLIESSFSRPRISSPSHLPWT
jgi:ribosome biogenesis protein ENP2